ncbi:MAG TPA: ice-binding family protein [Chitinophagales bacterium]|nr:ice-binding family protein [Chitinophagales bacterium]
MILKKTISAFAFTAVVLLAGCKKDTPNDLPILDVKVVSHSPVTNTTNVALDKVISATFSETMDASTFNNLTFTLKKGTTTVIGTVAYSGVTATFTSASPLTQNTVYTVNITTGVKNTAGKALTENVSWNFTTGTSATGLAVVNLGAAANYVILAKTAINNIPTSAIVGDIGLSPAVTSNITGFSLVDALGYSTSSQVIGRIYASDMLVPTPVNLAVAVSNMTTAYNDAAGRTAPDFSELGAGNIGGKILIPGVYKWTNSVTIPSTIVISGSASDVWIFQIQGTLSVSSSVNIVLSGGAKAENIFWQVNGETTLANNSNFKGIILSMSGITLKTGATFAGRALSQTAVILDSNTVTQP